jgi:hypothetical protein
LEQIRESKFSPEKHRETFVLKRKVNEIVTYLGIAKLWVDEIIEEIRAKKGR